VHRGNNCMIHFPTTVLNNFFEDPHGVIDIAKGDSVVWSHSENSNSQANGSWPGVRSQPLHEIDNDLYIYLMNKYLYTFFDDEDMATITYNAISVFHKIAPKWANGWIHNDFPDIHTFIIYLTPDADPKSGTGLYTPKNIHQKLLHSKTKKQYNLGEISKDEAEPARLEHNQQFDPDTMVYNRFNRLVGFDSHQWHGVESYDTGTEERLTLITFINKLSCPPSSYQRMKAVQLFRGDCV